MRETTITIEESKNKAIEFSELLNKLPKEKQEFVSGYIQGVADTIAEKAQKESA